jgi:hypothetical protein
MAETTKHLTPGITRRPGRFIVDESRRVGGRVHAVVRFRSTLDRAPLAHDDADDYASDRAQNYDRRIRLRDDSIRQTQDDAEDEPLRPPRQRQPRRADDEADGEAVKERARQSGPLIREAEREHGGGR